MTISQKVCAVIEQETGQSVTASTPLDSLECDSLEYLNLLLILEIEFDKELTEKSSKMHTVGDLIIELA